MGIIAPPAKPSYPNARTLVVAMSSTGAGVGSSSYISDPSASQTYGTGKPYASPPTSMMGLLTAALAPAGFAVFNRSKSGTSTRDSIDRFYSDIAVHRPSHVILGTSFWNEPLVSSNSDLVGGTRTFINNIRRLISLCYEIGAQPIVMTTCPNNFSGTGSYQAALDANAEIEQLGVPVIDMMSNMETALGRFVDPTYTADGTHATDLGHATYADAFDISIVTSSYRTLGSSDGGGGWRQTAPTGAAFLAKLSSPAKSFSMRAKIKTVSGLTPAANSALLCAMLGGTSVAPLRVRGYPYNLADPVGTGLATSTVDASTDFTTHEVGMAYNAVTNKAALYIDGAVIGSPGTVGGTIFPVDTFGVAYRPDTVASVAQNWLFSDICIWRSCLTANKFAEMYFSGRVPTASLALRAKLNHTPRQIVSNVAPTDVLPLIGTTWASVPAF